MSLERRAMAAVRTDPILGAPAERKIYGVRGAGHYRPPVRALVHDLNGGPGDTQQSLVYVKNDCLWCQANHLVPGAAAHVGVDVAHYTGPWLHFRHCRASGSKLLGD